MNGLTKNKRYQIDNIVNKYWSQYEDGVMDRNSAITRSTYEVLLLLNGSTVRGSSVTHPHLFTVEGFVENCFIAWVSPQWNTRT